MTSSESGPVPPPAASSRLRADGALVLLTAMWGSTFIVVKGALGDGDPFTFLVLRFTLGALALTAVVRGQVFVPTTLRRGALLGVFLFLGFVLQTLGLVSTSASRSAFITGLYVVLVPVFGWAFFRRAPRITSWVGVALAAVGLRYLTGAELEGEGMSRGDVLTLGCAVAYSFHILFTERYAPKTGAMPLVAVQLWVVAGLAALCLPFAGVRVRWTPAFVGTVAYCGLVASALALTVQTWAQARTTSVRAVLIYCLEPVFTAVYAMLLGYERLGPREWGGGGLIVLGVAVAEVGGALLTRMREGRAAG